MEPATAWLRTMRSPSTRRSSSVKLLVWVPSRMSLAPTVRVRVDVCRAFNGGLYALVKCSASSFWQKCNHNDVDVE